MGRDKESRVYAYGCQPPTAGWDAVAAEMRGQIRLWNRLVEIDREHDARVQASAEDALPELAEVRQELDGLDARIGETIRERRDARAKARARVPTPELDARLKDLRSQETAARGEYWRLMRQWRREHGEAAKALESRRRAEVTHARQTSGLYWGNYNRVVQGYETARKAARQKGRSLRPHDEADLSSGVITVQIQRTKSGLGAAPDEIFGGDVSGVGIAPVEDHAAKAALPRSRRTRAVRTTADVRVNVAGDRTRVPVWLHRPLPADCRVKSVQLVWRREGERTRWQLCLTISRARVDVWHPETAVCGVDLGWRLQADGSLRVATLASDAGRDRECIYALPARWMARMRRVGDLDQAIADHTLAFAGLAKTDADAMPEAVREAVRDWAPGRGIKWVRDQDLHDAVRADIAGDWPRIVRDWYGRYRRLRLERDNLRAKLLRERREHYRLWAREIAARYRVIALEKMDLSRMARVRKRDDDPELFAAARRQRQWACVHALRSEIEDQAGKHGAQVLHATGKSTMLCGQCGHATAQADRAQIDWTCEHCGRSWDQDRNAARNLVFVAASTAARAAAE